MPCGISKSSALPTIVAAPRFRWPLDQALHSVVYVQAHGRWSSVIMRPPSELQDVLTGPLLADAVLSALCFAEDLAERFGRPVALLHGFRVGGWEPFAAEAQRHGWSDLVPVLSTAPLITTTEH